MYFKSALRPPASSAPRPAKRRRRTATSVLAGDFDPRPERDFFTDMANSSDTQNPYNSVKGHGPGILFDTRSQEEKDVEIARELKRLAKNVKRKDKDIEKRREKEELKLKKAQKKVERNRETADAKAAQRAEQVYNVAQGSGSNIFSTYPSGTIPPPMSFTRGAPSHFPPSVPALLPPLQAGPSSRWSPSYRTPLDVYTYPSQGPFTSESGIAPSPVVAIQSATPPRPEGYPPLAAPTLAISTSPRASQLFSLSPPTPSRSISSYTSRTSSKRPHTPYDDDIPLTQVHSDESGYPTYDEDIRMIDQEPFESTSSGKRSVGPTLHNNNSIDEDPPTPEASPVYTRASFGPSSWVASQMSDNGAQSSGTTQNTSWVTGNPLQSASPEINNGIPGRPNDIRTSTSHRRDALSLAALLTEPSYALFRSRPVAPPTPELPATKELRSDYPGASVEAISDQAPESSIVAPSTIDSSCLSPLADASPINEHAVATLVTGEFNEKEIEEACESSQAGFLLSSLTVVAVPTATEVVDNGRPNTPAYEEPMDLDSAIGLIDEDEHMSQREASATPETSGKDSGRRSKAMLVIQSEDELTDLEDLDATLPTDKGKVKSTSMHASAFREQRLAGGEVFIPASSASPSANGSSAGPQRQKRPAARKGWKGWVEVEVEVEDDQPVRQFSLDVVPLPTLGERRTRSGRHFDA